MINTGGDSQGVNKRAFFKALGEERGRTPEQGKQIFKHLQEAWSAEGLTLTPFSEEAKWGSSFDAQRLILLARKQGRENDMIEAVYTANHVKGECLSDFNVLLDAAEKAGVTGAAELLNSDQLVDEVQKQIMHLHRMGVNSVPVLLINEKYPIHGSPEQEVLNTAFSTLIQCGELPIPPKRLLC